MKYVILYYFWKCTYFFGRRKNCKHWAKVKHKLWCIG